MVWIVEFYSLFAGEAEGFSQPVKMELATHIELLEEFGPALKRPYADTLNGSKHANMKELRFKAGGGVWRVAYAFDPIRKAVLLVAGNKSGVSEQRFYNALIKKADARFDAHLDKIRRK